MDDRYELHVQYRSNVEVGWREMRALRRVLLKGTTYPTGNRSECARHENRKSYSHFGKNNPVPLIFASILAQRRT